MITFETEKDFQDAVLQVVIDKLRLDVYAKGHPFMTGIDINICNVDDKFGNLITGSDSVI